MASTGLTLCTSGSTTGSANFSWSNAGNAVASDNSYATATTVNKSNGHNSNTLLATNFGFSIPSGSTINGVTARVERSASGSNKFIDLVISLYVGGSIVGSNKSVGTNWPTSDTNQDYGGASDLWGTTLSSSDVNDSNFGLAISVTSITTGAQTARVDAVWISIDYTAPQGRSRAIVVA